MGYSISTELSIYLPTKKADLDPEINHFITYLGDKSKFSKKIGDLKIEVPRLNWEFKDRGSLKYELVTLKNRGFKLILDEVSDNCRGSRGYGLEYLPVRIIHEDLKDYQYSIYVCVSIKHLLKTLIGSGYMSEGEIHGIYCMNSSPQVNSFWRYCYPVLDDRISLEEPKRVAKVMSENKRMNCTRWIPGHKYIISAESFAVCLGKISDYLSFDRPYSYYDRFTMLLAHGLTTGWGNINCENDGTLIYLGNQGEIEKIKGKTVSGIIKEYLSDKDLLTSYWRHKGLCICRKMNSGYYGWEDGDYVMNDILDEKNGIRNLVQEKCTEYFMGLDIRKDEELALVYMTGLGNDLISSSPVMKERVMKIAEKNIENKISEYNKSDYYSRTFKLGKDTDPNQVLAFNRGGLGTIRNFTNNFGLSNDEIKEMIKKALAKL